MNFDLSVEWMDSGPILLDCIVDINIPWFYSLKLHKMIHFTLYCTDYC